MRCLCQVMTIDNRKRERIISKRNIENINDSGLYPKLTYFSRLDNLKYLQGMVEKPKISFQNRTVKTSFVLNL